MSEQVEPKVKLSIFSLDLLDDNGVTVSLFPPIARGITDTERDRLIELAKEIERMCFTVMQRSTEFVQPPPINNVTDINVGSKNGKRKKKQS